MTKLHISSGGVVYERNSDGTMKFLLLYRHRTNTYHLPKGTQEIGETLKQTAYREILEETGCSVSIENSLGFLKSKFFRNGYSIRKKTYYYICKLREKDVIKKDNEHDTYIFCTIAEAKNFLKTRGGQTIGYEDEQIIIDRFLQHIL